jgi:enoyl-CoA hydratase/carnithine racemase
LTATSVAPAISAANSASCYSARLPISRASFSPGRIPSRKRPFASARVLAEAGIGPAALAIDEVILTGAGDKAFSSGADLGGDLSAGPETARIVNRALLKTTPFSKPIVAAVNGDCVAGGLELLLSTDIRAAVREARFGLPEVKWSIYPFGGATVKLIHLIGYVHAMDLLLTGRLIDADAAMRLGLVNRVVPAAELMPNFAALIVEGEGRCRAPAARPGSP